MDEVRLGFNTHGKGRVRLVKVNRGAGDKHTIQQLSIQILLQGYNMDNVYTDGNNSTVVATDTCKNTVYCLAHQHPFKSVEEFGIIICKHFLTEYSNIVNKITVDIIEDQWVRLVTPHEKKLTRSDGNLYEHKHAFKRIGPYKRVAHVEAFTKEFVTNSYDNKFDIQVIGGFTNLEVMKTTQSGFVGFLRDKYTTLPEVKDRLLGTSITAEWSFRPEMIKKGINYNEAHDRILEGLIAKFAGPSHKGIYSASVQQTLYAMGKCALNNQSDIDKITLQMPNIHNIPFPLENYGYVNKDHKGLPFIFYPIDEPHGMIKVIHPLLIK